MERSRVLKRGLITALAFSLVAVSFAIVKTSGKESDSDDSPYKLQWEYLVVAGPATTNFSDTGSGSVRKESNGGFAREAYVLEQHMDRLGRSGWELVTVSGPPTDPAFYFKRRKTAK